MNRLPFDIKSLVKAKYEILPGVEIETYGSMTVEELIKFTELQNNLQSNTDPLNATIEFVAWIMRKRTGDELWTTEAVLQLPQNIVQEILAFFANGESFEQQSQQTSDGGNSQLTGAQFTGDSDCITQTKNDLVVTDLPIAQ